MSSNSTNSNSSKNDAKVNFEYLWKEFVFKSVNLILNHRINWPIDRVKDEKTTSWFQIKLQETEEVNKDLEKLFKTFSPKATQKTIFIDIYAEETPTSPNEKGKKHLMERWCIEYMDKSREATLTEKQQDELLYQVRVAYRKFIVLFRSLFSYILLLPAYSIYQKLQKHRTGMGYTLGFVLSHVEPTSPIEPTYLRSVDFHSIEATSMCKLKVSVKYRKQKFSELLTVSDHSVLRESQIDVDYFSDNKNEQPINEDNKKKRTLSVHYSEPISSNLENPVEPSSLKEEIIPPLDIDRKRERAVSMPPKKKEPQNINNEDVPNSSQSLSKPVNIPLTFERHKLPSKFLPTETPPFSNAFSLGSSPASLPRQNSVNNMTHVSPPFSFENLKFSPIGSYTPPSLLSESLLKESPSSNQAFERYSTVPPMFVGSLKDIPSSLESHRHKFQMDFIPTLLEDIESMREHDEFDHNHHGSSTIDDDFPFLGSIEDMHNTPGSEGHDDDKDEKIGALLTMLSKASHHSTSFNPTSMENIVKDFEQIRITLQSLDKNQ
ncbi:hypothetical protein C9374_009680 [Naegleria lovaniensis]|uniref:Autophagy-related protein 13 N-terminal domain-containing protein n=1 Tax=Naegleria lovaniensis TaxID=51637 RepID=A0AA88H1X9_NAELO|nr:uncharacterized protein C9374_009680 [Naegleria lovaniensis]KAG2393103.1 hypothetical protein C9374_009680 [Naegleria lovaniensis]